MIFRLPDPIPREVKDPDDLQTFFDKYKIVPYYGTEEYTSHSMLELFRVLTTYSATFKAVVRDLAYYTFGLEVDIIGRARPGLAIEPIELAPEQQIAYQGWLADRGITTKKILKALRRADLHEQSSGNAYLVIRRITVGDTIRYDFKVPHYKHVAYIEPADGQDQVFQLAIISKYLGDIQKMQKYPPTILAVTQEDDPIIWNDTGQPGIEKAMIHIRNEDEDDEGSYYARPDILPILNWLYVEYEQGNQNSKVAATDLITKLLLAFQAPDPNTIPEEEFDDKDNGFVEVNPTDVPYISASGKLGKTIKKHDYFSRNMMILRELTTNLGLHPHANGFGENASTIAGVEYPFSGVAPTPIPLEMNRDTKHQEFQRDTAVAQICQTLRWAPELTSMRPAKTNLGGNLLFDMFTIKNESTITPRQRRFEGIINDILAQILERDGGPAEFQNYGIRLKDIITEMISKFKGSGAPSSPMNGETEDADPAANLNNPADEDPDDTQ